jgi:hypothetical protein
VNLGLAFCHFRHRQSLARGHSRPGIFAELQRIGRYRSKWTIGADTGLCRARVADSIFNHAAKAIEIEDIEARVTELERAAAAQADYAGWRLGRSRLASRD